MARYIEEETFVNFVQEHFCNGCNNYNGVKCRSCSVDDAISFVESAPTADVVPKSQYDLAVKEREANVKGFTEELTKVKTEVAREIFEEFEEIINNTGYIDEIDWGSLKKKYCGEGDNVPTKVKSGDICVICGEPVPEGRQVCKMCEVGQAFLDKKKE